MHYAASQSAPRAPVAVYKEIPFVASADAEMQKRITSFINSDLIFQMLAKAPDVWMQKKHRQAHIVMHKNGGDWQLPCLHGFCAVSLHYMLAGL